jgi:hypothetical protein
MEVKEALKWFEWADDVYYCSMPNASPNNEFYKQSKEIKNLLKSLESENKKLKQYQDMWEWIQGVEMWNKEYEQVVKEVVQDIEVGYKTGKTIEQIGYEKVEDKGLTDGISNKQNQKYIKKINTFEKLKQENEGYKGIVEDVRDIILHHIGHLEPNEVLDIIDNTSNKYLGGGE